MKLLVILFFELFIVLNCFTQNNNCEELKNNILNLEKRLKESIEEKKKLDSVIYVKENIIRIWDKKIDELKIGVEQKDGLLKKINLDRDNLIGFYENRIDSIVEEKNRVVSKLKDTLAHLEKLGFDTADVVATNSPYKRYVQFKKKGNSDNDFNVWIKDSLYYENSKTPRLVDVNENTGSFIWKIHDSKRESTTWTGQFKIPENVKVFKVKWDTLNFENCYACDFTITLKRSLNRVSNLLSLEPIWKHEASYKNSSYATKKTQNRRQSPDFYTQELKSSQLFIEIYLESYGNSGYDIIVSLTGLRIEEAGNQ